MKALGWTTTTPGTARQHQGTQLSSSITNLLCSINTLPALSTPKQNPT